MRLADILDTCAVKTVTIGPEVSLVDAARAMQQVDAMAALIFTDGKLQGILSADLIVRAVAGSPTQCLNDPVTRAITVLPQSVTEEEPVGRIIAQMISTGIDYLPVITGNATVIVTLGGLLRVENNYLHSEVKHMQTYIDALHDAPND